MSNNQLEAWWFNQMANENIYILSKFKLFIFSRESPEVNQLIRKLKELGLEFDVEVEWCG